MSRMSRKFITKLQPHSRLHIVAQSEEKAKKPFYLRTCQLTLASVFKKIQIVNTAWYLL